MVLGWALVSKPFHPTNKHKTWTRTLIDRAFYYATGQFNVKQLQWSIGDLRQEYDAWMKRMKLTPEVEELGENARLLWLGKQSTERVILYLHGAPIILPLIITPSYYFPGP